MGGKAHTTCQTIFLPVAGLVDIEDLKPGSLSDCCSFWCSSHIVSIAADLVGVNKDSYLILDKLPAEYDSRVKAMEVDESPTESYNEIGGLHKQIEVA